MESLPSITNTLTQGSTTVEQHIYTTECNEQSLLVVDVKTTVPSAGDPQSYQQQLDQRLRDLAAARECMVQASQEIEKQILQQVEILQQQPGQECEGPPPPPSADAAQWCPPGSPAAQPPPAAAWCPPGPPTPPPAPAAQWCPKGPPTPPPMPAAPTPRCPQGPPVPPPMPASPTPWCPQGPPTSQPPSALAAQYCPQGPPTSPPMPAASTSWCPQVNIQEPSSSDTQPQCPFTSMDSSRSRKQWPPEARRVTSEFGWMPEWSKSQDTWGRGGACPFPTEPTRTAEARPPPSIRPKVYQYQPPPLRSTRCPPAQSATKPPWRFGGSSAFAQAGFGQSSQFMAACPKERAASLSRSKQKAAGRSEIPCPCPGPSGGRRATLMPGELPGRSTAGACDPQLKPGTTQGLVAGFDCMEGQAYGEVVSRGGQTNILNQSLAALNRRTSFPR